MKLTEKQKLFCKYYLISLNATDAAIKAGYSKKTAKDIGCENLAKPNIHNEIQKLIKERADKAGITAEEVLLNLKKAIAIALGEEPHKMIIKEGLGEGVTQHYEKEFHKTDLNAFIKVNELYMRHLGMMNEKMELSMNEQIQDWIRGKR